MKINNITKKACSSSHWRWSALLTRHKLHRLNISATDTSCIYRKWNSPAKNHSSTYL